MFLDKPNFSPFLVKITVNFQICWLKVLFLTISLIIKNILYMQNMTKNVNVYDIKKIKKNNKHKS